MRDDVAPQDLLSSPLEKQRLEGVAEAELGALRGDLSDDVAHTDLVS